MDFAEVLSLLQRLGGVLAAIFYVALILWTYKDARRRIDDPILVATATAASVIPIVGVLVYMLLRPSEYLEDRQERDLEIRMMRLQLGRQERCPNPSCRLFIEHDYLVCPRCTTKLRETCEGCERPLDPSWVVCPHCETEVPGRTAPAPGRGGRGAAPRPSSSRSSSSRPRPSSGSSRPSGDEPRRARSETSRDEPARPASKRPEASRRSDAPRRSSESRARPSTGERSSGSGATQSLSVEPFGPDEGPERSPAGSGARKDT